MIRLYDHELCDDCYKVRLLLSLLGLEWETRRIDFHPGGEHESEWFLRINPLGRIPVIEDGDYSLRDAQAILVYLAARYDESGRWYPGGDARTCGEVAMWLSFAGALTPTASAARLHAAFAHDLDADRARSGAHRLFRVLDEHLWFAEQEGRDWLCAPEHPTIADIACFPGVMLSEEGGDPAHALPRDPPLDGSGETHSGLRADAGHLPRLSRGPAHLRLAAFNQQNWTSATRTCSGGRVRWQRRAHAASRSRM